MSLSLSLFLSSSLSLSFAKEPLGGGLHFGRLVVVIGSRSCFTFGSLSFAASPSEHVQVKCGWVVALLIIVERVAATDHPSLARWLSGSFCRCPSLSHSLMAYPLRYGSMGGGPSRS